MFDPTRYLFPINVVNMECLGVSLDRQDELRKDIKVAKNAQSKE